MNSVQRPKRLIIRTFSAPSSRPAGLKRNNLMTAHQPLNGRAVKITVVLEPVEVVALAAPEGQSRTVLHIKVGGRNVSADIATKSLRKAVALIRGIGADGCVALIQGKLGPDDVVLECGLVAQAKVRAVEAAPS